MTKLLPSYEVFMFAVSSPAELEARLDRDQESFGLNWRVLTVMYLGQHAKSAQDLIDTGGVAHYQVVWVKNG